MVMKLPPRELAFYKRCDEVLHYLWDPIGIAGSPGARDEYDAYLPQVFKLVVEGVPREQLVEYLLSIESERMGLAPKRPGAENAVDSLLEWWEWISE